MATMPIAIGDDEAMPQKDSTEWIKAASAVREGEI